MARGWTCCPLQPPAALVPSGLESKASAWEFPWPEPPSSACLSPALLCSALPQVPSVAPLAATSLLLPSWSQTGLSSLQEPLFIQPKLGPDWLPRASAAGSMSQPSPGPGLTLARPAWGRRPHHRGQWSYRTLACGLPFPPHQEGQGSGPPVADEPGCILLYPLSTLSSKQCGPGDGGLVPPHSPAAAGSGVTWHQPAPPCLLPAV